MADPTNNLAPGVLTGEAVQAAFALAKAGCFALPAVNVTGTNSMNAVMEAAGATNAPVVIQFSYGGAGFIAGDGLDGSGDKAAILGAISGATHVHNMAEAYGASVVLQTDHAPRARLGWIDGLLDAGESHMGATGSPLFSSHMLDLSAEPLKENVATCCEYLRRLSPLGMTLEIELGVTGGEEDGVDNRSVDHARLFTKPADVLYAIEELSKISDRFTIAAAFGNVHGVHKPGNVRLQPKILLDSQMHVQENLSTGAKPVNFVFHGGSGSTIDEIREAISYGVVKVNINTDLEWAFWSGVHEYEASNRKYLQSQIGNPDSPTEPNKRHNEPRAWLRSGEVALVDRLKRAFEELGNVTP